MDRLNHRFDDLPAWLKKAYHTDPAVNRCVKDWRMTSKPPAALYEALAALSSQYSHQENSHSIAKPITNYSRHEDRPSQAEGHA